MVSEKLKGIIFDKLYKDLVHVEIIEHEGSIWFIDRKEKYWYFRYHEDGMLWWRRFYFENFFNLFSLSMEDFLPILCEWIEVVLDCSVNRNITYGLTNSSLSDEVLKVTDT